jgi:hypothetical protein
MESHSEAETESLLWKVRLVRKGTVFGSEYPEYAKSLSGRDKPLDSKVSR